ncbi:MAG: three-Cys-motif partner protein TcmP [Chloroflexi bacterium]|nr:three-Cys-motif partner protein TcmP [Chloroflexota bacterium]
MQERARDVGPWSLEKLTLLRKYLAAYVNATKDIWERGDIITYVDLFAGPGLVKNRDTGEVFDGSPLIAMRLEPPFSRFILLDLDPDHVLALQDWVTRLGLQGKTQILQGDCNVQIQTVLRSLSRSGASFFFLDPPSPALAWNTITQISRIQMWPSGNKLEQFILFPYNMGLVRMLPRDENPELIWGETTEEQISSVMPDPVKWRKVYQAWQQGSFEAAQKRRRFLYLYWSGLKELGYNYVLGPRTIRRQNRRALYDLFFCSDHPVGNKIMADVFRPQLSFGEQLPLVQEDPYNFRQGERWYLDLSEKWDHARHNCHRVDQQDLEPGYRVYQGQPWL